ncbi:hypothetical protein EU508_09215 [Pseudoalteromonas fuliginea]|uniref:Uncharacterized protein n=1 Tax=Pseudoalteromonas fuliginea TaxID=1872678 RepID=A0AB73BGZ2_9GAMM|nr:hypothetical protein [Pseudoalteromonas fuliginea]KAA1160625.1 hypothetical protein EU508_09215 [Pseudoalteromonas fuliginea]
MYLDATEFRNDDEFTQYAKGKVAQLRLILNSKESALQKDKEINQQAKAQDSALAGDELRRRALSLAAQNRMVTI